MTNNDGTRSNTINSGSAPKPREEERDREFDATGNVRRKGEVPSPDDRVRGETSGADDPVPVDTGNG